jgi:predicted MPP superfamily phosphohydrolase
VKRKLLSLLLFIQVAILFGQQDFSFAFLPDLHLRPDSAVLENFERLSENLNALNTDFILTGGDMIYTAKSVNDKKAAALFDLMDKEFKLLKMPIYLTMGNHETVGITEESGIDKSNPMWGKRMYEKRYTNSYYSFTKEGWKFFVLDGIKILEKEKNYTQGVDSLQIEWMKDELSKTDKDTPIVISIHTPLINPHAMSDSDSRALSSNAEAVLNLFEDNDLRIVLQGHNHTYMNLYIHGVHYISGGSTQYGTSQMENGFVLVKVKNGVEEVEFIPSFSTDTNSL